MERETHDKVDCILIIVDQDKYKLFDDHLHEHIHIHSIDYDIHQIDKQNNLFNEMIVYIIKEMNRINHLHRLDLN